MDGIGYLASFMAVVGTLSAGIAWLLATKWPSLSRRRIVAIAPLPLPAMLILLCVIVAIDAARASAEECGVDACGMAMAGAMFGAVTALVVYFLGTVIAEVTLRFVKPEGRDDRP
jgi:hypothetical protein